MSSPLALPKIPYYAPVLDDVDKTQISRVWLNYFQSLGNQIAAGALTGTGTPGTVPLWATASTLGDSVITQTPGAIAVTGTLTATGGFISGADDTLHRAVNTAVLTLSGGNTSAAGAQLVLYGGAHGTKASQWLFKNSAFGGVDFEYDTNSGLILHHTTTVTPLAGAGTRLVLANSTGTLSAGPDSSAVITGAGTANNVTMFTGPGAVGDAPGLTYSAADGGGYTFANLATVTATLTAGFFESASLAGTGTRLVGSTSVGILNNPSAFSGSYTFTGTLGASNLSGTNTGDQTVTLTGDVTGSGTGTFATVIGANKVLTSMILNSNVTLAKIANIADQTILGNNSGGAAAPIALTASQTRTVLGLGTGDSPTLTGLTLSGLTASLPVFTNGSKQLVSNTMTGSGSVVMSAGPTGTGTWALASAALSGTIAVTGVSTLTGNVNINGATDTANWRMNVKDGHIAATGTFGFYSFGVGNPAAVAAGNYETLSVEHSGTNGLIRMQKSGTGSYRDLMVQNAGATQMSFLAAGTVDMAVAMTTRQITVGSSDLIYMTSTGKTQIVINSVGSYYGTIQNDSANTWSLGYKTTNSTSLGTSALTWNSSGNVNIRGKARIGDTASAPVWDLELVSSGTTVFAISSSGASADNKTFAIQTGSGIAGLYTLRDDSSVQWRVASITHATGDVDWNSNHTGMSSLLVSGAFGAGTLVSSSATGLTVNSTHYTVVYTGAGVKIITLPQASTCLGRIYVLVNRNNGALTIARSGSDNIVWGNTSVTSLSLNWAVAAGGAVVCGMTLQATESGSWDVIATSIKP